jgi:hypothetical protein
MVVATSDLLGDRFAVGAVAGCSLVTGAFATTVALAGDGLDVDQPWPGFDDAGEEREVLAKGVALELRG